MNKPKQECRKLMLCVTACIMLVLASGWGKALAQEAVVYRLKWLINMSTVGDVYAQVQGFFDQAGLRVTIKPGGPERDAIRELELGYADFGVASADQVIRALAKGAPVVVLAQLFQVNPLQWIYRRDRLDLHNLSALRGKTIGVTFGKNDEFIMRTLLSAAHIDSSQVRLFSVRLDYTPFYKGEVDLWPVYINTQGVEIGARMRQAGESIAFFNPVEYGVRFVSNSVVTSQRMLAQQPETVRRFIKALLRGWRQAIDPANTADALAAVRHYDKDTAMKILEAQMESTRPLIQPNPRVVVGAIDRQAWQQTEEIMLAHQQIDHPVHVLRYLKPLATH